LEENKMEYVYKSKRFSDEKQITKWLNKEQIKSEDIVSISAYCEEDAWVPRFSVFYKEYKKQQ
jgi:hypothetical protein